jgi:hypothetical protein
MTVCDLTKDIGKLKAFMKENNLSASEMNNYLYALLQMEGATTLSFVNVYFGYLLAKAIRDAMCKMCKEGDDVAIADWHTTADQARGEAFAKRSQISNVEKENACFLLQFVNNMQNNCPSVAGAPKVEDNNTFSRLVPPMGLFPPRPC